MRSCARGRRSSSPRPVTGSSAPRPGWTPRTRKARTRSCCSRSTLTRLRRGIRARILELTGVEVGVVVSDSFGRAWRLGTTDVALGVAGITALVDLDGQRDSAGYELHATQIAVADEIAGAAQLVMGKLDGIPAALVRGLRAAGQTGAEATCSCPASATCSVSGARLAPCASTRSGALRPRPSRRNGCGRSASQFEADEFVRVDDIADADFVLNMFDPADPRRSGGHHEARTRPRSTSSPEAPDDALKASYPMLVRTLSNVVLLRVPGEGVWFTTMEQGTYHVSEDPAAIYERLEPLATSRLVIDNEWIPDLEPELWDGDEVTADISESGQRPRRARPPAVSVPRRGLPLRPGPPARHAALLGRRAFRTGISRRARTRRGSG